MKTVSEIMERSCVVSGMRKFISIKYFNLIKIIFVMLLFKTNTLDWKLIGNNK
jgi:hypothetical protein